MPPAGTYSKAMARPGQLSTGTSVEEAARMRASQYCAYTWEKGIEVTAVVHKAQLEPSYPQLPMCTWCGDETGHYCEAWRPPIQRLRDAFATEAPGITNEDAGHLTAWWGCGMPLCLNCDSAMHGCIDCYCRKGDMLPAEAAKTHFFCMTMPRAPGNANTGPPGLSF